MDILVDGKDVTVKYRGKEINPVQFETKILR